MKNQKGMSEIVTTIIMVVLALVAVAVIWQIINSLIGEKGTQISVTQKCLDVKLAVEGVSNCESNESCDVRIRRSAGGDAFDGIKFVFKSPTDSSNVVDVPGSINELETETITANISAADDFDLSIANKVEATIYFLDESGQAQNCPAKTEYNF